MGRQVVTRAADRARELPGSAGFSLPRHPSRYKIRTVVSIVRICTATLGPASPRPPRELIRFGSTTNQTHVFLTLMSQKPVSLATILPRSPLGIIVWGEIAKSPSDAERRECSRDTQGNLFQELEPA